MINQYCLVPILWPCMSWCSDQRPRLRKKVVVKRASWSGNGQRCWRQITKECSRNLIQLAAIVQTSSRRCLWCVVSNSFRRDGLVFYEWIMFRAKDLCWVEWSSMKFVVEKNCRQGQLKECEMQMAKKPGVHITSAIFSLPVAWRRRFSTLA